MTLRYASIAVGLFVCGAAGPVSAPLPSAYAAERATAARPAISAEASAAIAQMGKSLSAKEFSFKAQTIRVYPDRDGRLLHIFHTNSVVVRRPDRLFVDAVGDNGTNRLFYDGKMVAIVAVDQKKYAEVPAPNNIQGMMAEVMGRLHVDFPLADLLTTAPGKAFLSGVTSGREVNTVTIDGKPYRHLFFLQKGDIELELWLEQNEQALPRRLIVTYRSLPGQPEFIAEFSDWNFSIHPSDSQFVFQPPPGATRVALKPAVAAPGQNGGK